MQTPLPVNMHFIVKFQNPAYSDDTNFQSVQGIQARILPDEVPGGNYARFENIILKRAYQPDSKLIEWCMNAINNRKKEPEDLIIELLNADHQIISGWRIERAIPIAWGVEELHAQNPKVLIETIELKPKYFQVLNSKGKVIAPIPQR